MVWNTVTHPKMMTESQSGGGGDVVAFDNVVFSEEVLESPIKYMNRDLLATFDVISMGLIANRKIIRIIPLVHDFDSLYAAAKNGTIIRGLSIRKAVKISEGGVVSSDTDRPVYGISALCGVEVFEGKCTIATFNVDFKDDRFVAPYSDGPGSGFIVYASDGAVYDIDTWLETILPKYKVGTDSEPENPNPENPK